MLLLEEPIASLWFGRIAGTWCSAQRVLPTQLTVPLQVN
jgi:hypothetical protein